MSDNPERPDAGSKSSQPAEIEVPQDSVPETDGAEHAAADPRDEQIAALEAERDDFKDRWMRSEAEMANLRTRTRREAEDARQYAVQKFARDIAEVADTLKRGLNSLPPVTDADPDLMVRLRSGFEGVERAFVSVLERHGVAQVDPTGTPFDPNLHQAMSEQPSAEHPPGTVLQAWTPAWTLNGRLLRPAMVVVSTADPAAKHQDRSSGERGVDIKA